jgi:hypothetical protein
LPIFCLGQQRSRPVRGRRGPFVARRVRIGDLRREILADGAAEIIFDAKPRLGAPRKEEGASGEPRQNKTWSKQSHWSPRHQ